MVQRQGFLVGWLAELLASIVAAKTGVENVQHGSFARCVGRAEWSLERIALLRLREAGRVRAVGHSACRPFV